MSKPSESSGTPLGLASAATTTRAERQERGRESFWQVLRSQVAESGAVQVLAATSRHSDPSRTSFAGFVGRFVVLGFQLFHLANVVFLKVVAMRFVFRFLLAVAKIPLIIAYGLTFLAFRATSAWSHTSVTWWP